MKNLLTSLVATNTKTNQKISWDTVVKRWTAEMPGTPLPKSVLKSMWEHLKSEKKKQALIDSKKSAKCDQG
jgi:hypothetical protein